MALTVELRVGESMTVGERITITLEKKDGQRSRLRVDAPADVAVRRVNPTLSIRAQGLGKKSQ